MLTISLEKMTLRKKTKDSTVRYVPQSEQSQSTSKDSKPTKRKNVSNPIKNKAKEDSQNGQKFHKGSALGVFGILK